jgi:hypothetical protein
MEEIGRFLRDAQEVVFTGCPVMHTGSREQVPHVVKLMCVGQV